MCVGGLRRRRGLETVIKTLDSKGDYGRGFPRLPGERFWVEQTLDLRVWYFSSLEEVGDLHS